MSSIYSLFIEIFKYACMPATNGENCLVNKIGRKTIAHICYVCQPIGGGVL